VTSLRARLLAPFVLAVLVAVIHGPLVTIPTWKGTESRRVEVAVEMLDPRAPSPPGIVPTLGLEPTYAKPPFYYWVLAAVAAAAGPTKEAMRMPSLVALWLLSWLAWNVLRRRHGEATAWLGAAGTIGCGAGLGILATAEIDPLFACLTAGSVLMLADSLPLQEDAEAGRGRARPSVDMGRVAFAGVLAGAAMLTKAFPWFVFALGGLVVALRSGLGWHAAGLWLGLATLPLLGWGAALLAFAPPAGESAESVRALETDESFAAYLFRESIGRILERDWRRAPEKLLEYVATIVGALFVFLPTFRWRAPRPAFDRVLLASATTALLVFLAFPHRPLRYFLPALPIAIFALAPDLTRWIRQNAPTPALLRRTGAVIGILGALVVLASAFVDHPVATRLPALGVVVTLTAWLVRSRAWIVVHAIVLLPLAVAWTVFADLARYETFGVRSSERAAYVLARHLEADERPLVGSHFHPPCQLFLELGIVPEGGDEQSATGVIEQPLVLVEEPFGPLSPLQQQAFAEFDVRVRVVGKSRCYVLRERRE
jgi:4-amino-4-deoxy-L-arabinose transferase-like glycosyltransferase